VRPGSLTDEPGSGRVAAARSLARRGQIPRDDVALVVLEVLSAPSTVALTFDVLAGESPVADAVRALRRSG
jgi:hypothetical protein